MTVKQFTEKMIEGGYTTKHLFQKGIDDTTNIFLDPEAWKAVGKVEGWGVPGRDKTLMKPKGRIMDIASEAFKPYWVGRMHAMIDALAEGKTIEQYLETL